MAQQIDLELARGQLEEWFAKKMPEATDITLSPLKPPGAGSSNETYFLTLNWREGQEARTLKMVMRWPPLGDFLVFPRYAYDMSLQYRVLKGLSATKVPVPPVHWMEEDPSVIGVPFYIMGEVNGWVPGDFPAYHVSGPLFEASEAERAQVWFDAVETLARIHEVDWQGVGLDFLGPKSGKQGFIESQIAYYDEVFALNGEAMPPILAKTRDWLLKNRFTPKRLSLCWGDTRLGNMVFRDHKVVAVLDWEMACIGDPESDLAWFAHIDWTTSGGRPVAPIDRLAGLPDVAATIAHYEKVSGHKVENFHYYDVLAAYRLAILFTRIEQDEKYLTRSGRPKGVITGPHFEKLERLLAM